MSIAYWCCHTDNSAGFLLAGGGCGGGPRLTGAAAPAPAPTA